MTSEERILCKNCRVSELKSRRELLHGSCYRCLAKVDEFIRRELNYEPDYRAAFVRDGTKYIPGRIT